MTRAPTEAASRLYREHELLLRAVTHSGGEALKAFEAWRAGVDLDAAIDPESYGLLPLLYGTLRKIGLDDPFMGRLKGICRRTWYENQILLEAARGAAARLAGARVAAFLVGDLPLALAHDRSLSARRIGCVDFVILPRQAQFVANLLGQSGWLASGPLRDEEVAYNHAKAFTNPAGQQLRLHWHFLEAAANEAADDAFRTYSEDCPPDRMRARQLSPTGLLLHLLLAGGAMETGSPRLWIADALVVMGEATGRLDWGRMTEFALRHRLAFRLRRKFEVLSGYGAPIPASAHDALRKAKISLPESVDSIVLRGASLRRRRMALWRCGVLADYLRSDRQPGLAKRLPDFSHFVTHRWGLTGRRQILPLLARHVRQAAAPEWS